MADEKAFQVWLDRITQLPLPKSKMARVRTLAKELAEGVSEGFWGTQFSFISQPRREPIVQEYLPFIPNAADASDEELSQYRTVPRDNLMRLYFKHRWAAPIFDQFPEYSVLFTRGYLTPTKDLYDRVDGVQLLAPAFELLDETEPANVFISYKRSESSALALLVLARLKEIGLQPFVDMSIEPGSNWRDFLKERIDASDYVVVLIGHNGFQYRTADWQLLPDIDRLLSDTHTIIVQTESAGGYNAALTELANRFGFTP